MLKDKVAIVTGGSRGIGRAIASRFAENGCTPVIVDIAETEGARALDEIHSSGRSGRFFQCDVSNSEQIRDVVDAVIKLFGKIDILVNNAGVPGGLPRSIADISEEDWDVVLNINLRGVFLFSKAVVPYMKERREGRIINISSMAAISPPAPLIHYSSSKAGILGLTLDLALELAPFNVCVNAILPGAIQTGIFDHMLPPGADKEAFFREMGKSICPMGRVGVPEDVANAAVFLASDLSSYMTGDRLLVGGGAPLVNRIKGNEA